MLHGGGNTSVKIQETSILGEPEDILYVKGSGWDLIDIEAPGFAPVRMNHLVRLAGLERLSDPEMVNELRTHMTNAQAPTPSVEAILHAILPYKYVDHTHADAVVTITNTANGAERIREIYGDTVVLIPYVMPGFDLARVCHEMFQREAGPRTLGMVLMNHGIFSFGGTAKESYDRMIALVSQAEDYLKAKNAWELTCPAAEAAPIDRLKVARARHSLSTLAEQAMLLQVTRDAQALSFCTRQDLDTIARQGPATPDHVIRTKRVPCLGQDFNQYTKDYQAYFETHSQQSGKKFTMLDPVPRVILDAELGLITAGKTIKDASIVRDIYQHTMDIILRSEMLGGYQALPAKDIFDVEYWDLEQAKLRKSGSKPMFTGEVVLVTGAASGIGKACVEAFLSRGAAVVGLDINPAIKRLFNRAAFLGIECDVSDRTALEQALDQTVCAFGGLDMLVLNAGMFPGGCRIDALDSALWRQVMQVNLDANLLLMQLAYPLLQLAPNKGRAVVIGSKNVVAPGPGAAAYSASKAALTQLMRIAALEWGEEGMRINALHPDAVFDTGIWTDEVLQARASHYGMSVTEYKTRNLLKQEVTSRDVAELAAELCGPLFNNTTAAQIPVDGGNERVI